MKKAFIEDNAFTQALQRELPFGARKGKPVKDITSPADPTKFLTLLYIYRESNRVRVCIPLSNATNDGLFWWLRKP